MKVVIMAGGKGTRISSVASDIPKPMIPIQGKPVLEALNKADKTEADTLIEPADAILISAATGKGLDALKIAISERIAAMRRQVELTIPYSKGSVLSLLHAQGQVENEEYLDTGTKVTCRLDSTLYARVLKMLEE